MNTRPTKRLGEISIGALAKRTGVNIETIRYYERIGILPTPSRTGGGHRLFTDEQVKRLRFVGRSRQLGFSLDEVRALLGLVDGGDYVCTDIKIITDAHLRNVRRKIADLRKIERILQEMVAQCSDDIVPDCPIVDALSGDRVAGLA